MINFPKLRSPINTYKLTPEDRLIILAYDMLWRVYQLDVDTTGDAHYGDDMDANLANLGHHIETVICGGDVALRFEESATTKPIGLDILPE